VKRHRQEPGPENLAAAARAVDVTDPRVLEAIRRMPRAAFVPAAYVTRAYDDAPIPIPHQQVTTQPSLSAAMIAALGLTGTVVPDRLWAPPKEDSSVTGQESGLMLLGGREYGDRQ
jgi:Protein-L-isoaspartate(D-aspartate) O-methyltransferase (PCMT)